jgi:hypothetical protein
MASFDELYRMQQGQNNPLINLQQMQARMPNWLTAPTPQSGNLGATRLFADVMSRPGEVDRQQQSLDIQRQRAKDVADIQMQTFQAELAQKKQALESRKAYAEENPEFATDIMAGEDPTDFQRKMASVGGDPARFREVYGPGTGPQVEVNMPGQRSKQQEMVDKAFGQDYLDMLHAGRSASQENAKLSQVDTLLDKTYTGIGAEKVLAAKKLGKMLGMDIEGIGEAEAAQAITSELALQLRNPAGGAGMPGAMSDKDREFLQSMVPGLALTPEGRKILISTKKSLNDRSIEVAKMATAYRRKHKRMDEGFFDELAAYSEANPMFEKSEQGDSGVSPGGVPAGWSIERL